ncbi:tyrosine-type recombinase/integrase [Actinomadura sp. HBU206391]|uniref:tyrosine-type recombinase/integrase n=1 Tax=Actinomadura sp. HBU206391 TaxID=2731692 RepID=UPI00164F1E33|nr:tyrosine-type recombinase/integrase [Actinomadura sp. HBU206391]MBC6457750.1 tyrosine-type recombinase/integrase [Actinomadura sp. HBU206391]
MAFSHDVRIYSLAKRKNRNRGHGVRWNVAGKQFSKWFTQHALADNHRSKLMQAARKGEGFDTETGLPESTMREQRSVTWFDLACRFVDLKWPHAAAKSRTAMADALATVTPAMVTTTTGKPDATVLRAALYGWAFHRVRRESTQLRGEEAAALRWVRDNSLKIVTLDEKERRSELIRRALDTIALKMDGKPAAATTVARKRAVFYSVLNYAVELDVLPANPINKVTWSAPEVAEEIDRSVVARPRQVQALLTAIDTERPELTAFFGCLYYAYMRPGEAKSLRRRDCVDLPDTGWGHLLLTGNAPRVGSEWSDTGSSHEERQLKHRARKITRPVPIPPELVQLLRKHLSRFGTTPDGHLFRGERGGPLSESVYGRAWQKARHKTFSASQAASPLAARPYDLRHSGVTLGLNAGVPAPEVARRAGHSVEVLLRVYAGCVDGHEQIWNSRIDDAIQDDVPKEVRGSRTAPKPTPH